VVNTILYRKGLWVGRRERSCTHPTRRRGRLTGQPVRPPTPNPRKVQAAFLFLIVVHMQVLLLRHTTFYSTVSQCEQGWIVIVPFLEYLVEWRRKLVNYVLSNLYMTIFLVYGDKKIFYNLNFYFYFSTSCSKGKAWFCKRWFLYKKNFLEYCTSRFSGISCGKQCSGIRIRDIWVRTDLLIHTSY
jgi:hypothetical protein